MTCCSPNKLCVGEVRIGHDLDASTAFDSGGTGGDGRYVGRCTRYTCTDEGVVGDGAVESSMTVDDRFVSCSYNSISSVPSAIRINAFGLSLVVIL